MVLEAPVAEPLAAGQGELPSLPRAADKRPSPRPVPPTPRPPGLRLVAGGAPPPLPDLADDDALPWQKRRPKRPVVAALVAPEGAARLAPLVDRLGNRLGLARLHRLVPVESHVPERAQRAAPLFEPLLAGWPTGTPRPVRLLDPPEPIEVTAPVPDDPPVAFRWRRRHRRVRRADGPERIASEWWRRVSPPDARAIRDYYRIEDEDGRRFWVFRAGLYEAGTPPLWYLHGVFP
jgi:protein ImuB